MARRASSSVHPVRVLSVIALVLAAVGGCYYLFSTVSDPYRTISPLDVTVYLENSNSLRGNVYKIAGTVDDQLAWSTAEGRLLSIEVDSQSASSRDILPLLVPPEFNHVNIQRGQRYLFKVEVGDKGILRAADIQKR